MPEDQGHYGRWSKEELRQAEATACRFLEENSGQIAETMQAKAKFLQGLIARLSLKETGFRTGWNISPALRRSPSLIQDDADGFFDLASQPIVARILGSVRNLRGTPDKR